LPTNQPSRFGLYPSPSLALPILRVLSRAATNNEAIRAEVGTRRNFLQKRSIMPGSLR
jgi:hypothetical protein